MWRQLPGVQKPRQVSQGKRFREPGLLGTPGAVSLHGPGSRWKRPDVEGGPLAEVPALLG